MASEKELSELGRLLAAAWSYQVLSRDGRYVGLVDHVRYERHSDHPDEIVVRRRNVFWGRRRVVPFAAVESVDPRRRTVTLEIDAESVARLPHA